MIFWHYILIFSFITNVNCSRWDKTRSSYDVQKIFGKQVFVPGKTKKAIITKDGAGMEVKKQTGKELFQYHSTDVSQGEYNDLGKLEQAGQRALQKNKVAKQVYEGHVSRPHFAINSNSAMVVQANRALANPEGILYQSQQITTTIFLPILFV